MERVRECTVCEESFTIPRTVGRPRERCSDRCDAIAKRRNRINYVLRHYAAPVAARGSTNPSFHLVARSVSRGARRTEVASL